MQRAEFSELDVDADRHRVLGIVVARLEAGAIRIGRARAGKRGLYGRAGGGHHPHLDARDRDPVARLHDRVSRLGVELRVRFRNKVIGRRRGLNVRPMIDEMLDRDELGELGYAAEMIAVPMGDDEMVDLRQTGVLDGRHDAPGVPDRRVRRHIAGIDEERFARWRHQERGVAALDVDHVDVERGAGLGGRAVGSSLREQRQSGDCEQHFTSHGPFPLGPVAISPQPRRH